MHRQSIIVIGIVLCVSGCTGKPTASAPDTQTQSGIVIASSETTVSTGGFLFPLNQAKQRITKKPFGIFITPATSPVQPERFRGFHTGIDFETFPSEQSIDVPVTAVCTGTVRFTGWVNGYGGVLVEQCIFKGQTVTVLYGHLNAGSITIKKNSTIDAGTVIGLLGKGYSSQTDGERKHLHLAVHKGRVVDYRGYVQTESELNQWIDPYAP